MSERQDERFRREHEQRVTELQSALRRNEQDVNTLRQQNRDLLGQEGRLRREQQRVTELQSQSRRKEQATSQSIRNRCRNILS